MGAASAEVIDNPPIKSGKKSIVVVLGMHRSGTSAVTRGLTVLGVELGDRLMPPKENINDRGFFEDIDINDINVALYRSLRSRQRWHSLIPVPADELLSQKNAPLRLQAIELLKSRLENVEYFGIKDPRICCTLPFWQSVFEHLQLDVSYVIAIRNPSSVARSLGKRNKFPLEKSYYLWLDHVLPSVLLTQGAPRVLVDYDLLLADPYKQISRIAIHLGLAKRLDAARLAEFSQNFLDKRLRHANFDLEDIYHDPTVPPPVKTAAAVLSDVATGHLDLDSEYVTEVFTNLSQARKPFRLIGKEVLLGLFRRHKKK
jgi:hypothetical protein